MNAIRVYLSRIEDILNSEKGSRLAKEVLYFIGRDWIGTNKNHEQDHLHPESRFSEPKPFSISIEEWKNWRILRKKKKILREKIIELLK